jgi:hypothetical protein
VTRTGLITAIATAIEHKTGRSFDELFEELEKAVGMGQNLTQIFSRSKNPSGDAIQISAFIKKHFGWTVPIDAPLNTLCS